jgi:hypothetical protein
MDANLAKMAEIRTNKKKINASHKWMIEEGCVA